MDPFKKPKPVGKFHRRKKKIDILNQPSNRKRKYTFPKNNGEVVDDKLKKPEVKEKPPLRPVLEKKKEIYPQHPYLPPKIPNHKKPDIPIHDLKNNVVILKKVPSHDSFERKQVHLKDVKTPNSYNCKGGNYRMKKANERNFKKEKNGVVNKNNLFPPRTKSSLVHKRAQVFAGVKHDNNEMNEKGNIQMKKNSNIRNGMEKKIGKDSKGKDIDKKIMEKKLRKKIFYLKEKLEQFERIKMESKKQNEKILFLENELKRKNESLSKKNQIIKSSNMKIEQLERLLADREKTIIKLKKPKKPPNEEGKRKIIIKEDKQNSNKPIKPAPPPFKPTPPAFKPNVDFKKEIREYNSWIENRDNQKIIEKPVVFQNSSFSSGNGKNQKNQKKISRNKNIEKNLGINQKNTQTHQKNPVLNEVETTRKVVSNFPPLPTPQINKEVKVTEKKSSSDLSKEKESEKDKGKKKIYLVC